MGKRAGRDTAERDHRCWEEELQRPLKAQCHEIFDYRLFFIKSSLPLVSDGSHFCCFYFLLLKICDDI